MIRRLLAAVLGVLWDDPRPRLDPVERQTLGVDEHADQAIAIVTPAHIDRALGYCGPDCELCAGSDVDALITSVQADVAQVLAERSARGSRNLRSVK